MALKLSYSASETLSDIVLHTLQNEGLQKAEAIEKDFYDALERIHISPEAQNKATQHLLPNDVKATVLNNQFAIAYQTQRDDVLILDICHMSRYAPFLNT